ncbi:MAG TPA: aminoglycoside phosphotransferase family protein [Patescibacteria group bacterium]|nr:aminoglycoside phosphotransferase family protein [Patescibacteria group bacterium]
MNKEVITEVLGRTGVQIEHFDVSALNPEDFTPGNRSNVWYFKDYLGLEMVLKEYPTWVDSGDVSWIHKYMIQLSQVGFPLTRVIGEAVQKDNHYYGIYEFAHGSFFDKENQSHSTSLARTLRRLHDLSQNIKISGSRNWPTIYKYEPNQQKLVLFDIYNDGKLLEPAWRTAKSLLQNKTVSVIPIHGDFRRDNIRFDQSGVTRVFDFGNSRNDYAEVDLAITLRDVAGNTKVTQRELLKTYRDSGTSKVDIVPEAICASSLILSIQECLYLWKENSQNPSMELRTGLAREIQHLESQITVIPQNLSLYKEVFS